jgi:hypothetical protein
MPNGGSDCCGTCWFNARNKGKAGHEHARDPELAVCTIRDFPIGDPFYTYCANHPHRRPVPDPIPIGPVFSGGASGERKLLRTSPDTEEIRRHLLALLSALKERPSTEYPIGPYCDEVVVWQSGEFREARAIEPLRRVTGFAPESAARGPFARTRHTLVRLAREALEKIAERPP